MRIKKGLAQIQLLDRQLQRVVKKASVAHDELVDSTFITKRPESDQEIPTVAAESGEVPVPKKVLDRDARENQRLWSILNGEDSDLRDRDEYLNELQALAEANAHLDQKLAEYDRMGRLCNASDEESGAVGDRRRNNNSDFIAQQVRCCDFMSALLSGRNGSVLYGKKKII